MKVKTISNLKVYGLCFGIILILGLSVLAPYLIPNDPYLTQLSISKMPPSLQYPFGTDGYGRCVFSRVLMGTRLTVFIALFIVLGTALFGTIYGSLSGYLGGGIDRLLMMFVDILLAFPDMILAIAVAGILGGGMFNVIIALSLTGWTSYARVARSSVMVEKSAVYIQAGKLSGLSHLQMIFKQILPNILDKIIIMATLQMSTVMMGIAGLSFLGIGIQIPQAEWGSMLSESRSLMQIAPWTLMGPGLAILISILLFNAFGAEVSKRLKH